MPTRLLFLTVLCTLFVLCVHMYYTLSDCTVVSLSKSSNNKLGRLDIKKLLRTDSLTDSLTDTTSRAPGCASTAGAKNVFKHNNCLPISIECAIISDPFVLMEIGKMITLFSPAHHPLALSHEKRLLLFTVVCIGVFVFV